MRTGLRTVALRTSFKMPVSVETILETPSLETPAFRVYRPVYLALFTRLRLLQHLLRGYCYGFKKYGFAATLPVTIASVTILQMLNSVVTPLVTPALVTVL